MQIINLEVGYLSTNCYIIIKNKECLIVDPGDNFHEIDQKIKDYKLVGILITHYHEDHILALSDLLNKYNVLVYDHKTQKKNHQVNSFNFEIIDTKGHTDDSVTFYFKPEKVMFTGDFLFKNSIGRCDFENINFDDMKQSISKIKKYDSNIAIYPGHGKSTTIKDEVNNNYFLK